MLTRQEMQALWSAPEAVAAFCRDVFPIMSQLSCTVVPSVAAVPQQAVVCVQGVLITVAASHCGGTAAQTFWMS